MKQKQAGSECDEVGMIIYKQTREQGGIFAVLVIYKSPQHMGKFMVKALGC